MAFLCFDQFGITKQVKASFGKTVNLPSGAYLILEHTEALHVIDVNSGYKSVSNNQEENAVSNQPGSLLKKLRGSCVCAILAE